MDVSNLLIRITQLRFVGFVNSCRNNSQLTAKFSKEENLCLAFGTKISG